MRRPSILEKIERSTRLRLESRYKECDLEALRKSPLAARKPLSLAQALRAEAVTGAMVAAPRVIAEIKSYSPSQKQSPGERNTDLDPLAIANSYVNAGAAAISVLTEPEFFGGDIENLKLIRQQHASIVLLQKDFIIDAYQIEEARSYGADAILLILSMLNPNQAHEFNLYARALGLSVLCEVHDESEMAMALEMGMDVIGVNNRNLHTLEVSLDVSRRLANIMTGSTGIFVSESGIETRKQINDLQTLGYNGFLIGTALMRTESPGQALSQLLQPVGGRMTPT